MGVLIKGIKSLIGVGKPKQQSDETVTPEQAELENRQEKEEKIEGCLGCLYKVPCLKSLVKSIVMNEKVKNANTLAELGSVTEKYFWSRFLTVCFIFVLFLALTIVPVAIGPMIPVTFALNILGCVFIALTGVMALLISKDSTRTLLIKCFAWFALAKVVTAIASIIYACITTPSDYIIGLAVSSVISLLIAVSYLHMSYVAFKLSHKMKDLKLSESSSSIGAVENCRANTDADSEAYFTS